MKGRITIGTLGEENGPSNIIEELISQSMMDKLLGKSSKDQVDGNKYMSNAAAPQQTQPDETENASTAMSLPQRRGHSKTTYMSAQDIAHLKKRWTMKEHSSLQLGSINPNDSKPAPPY